MNLLERIISCNSDEEADTIITEAIKEADEKSEKIERLGFLEPNKVNAPFKGFIPLQTRIKYTSIAVETYGMSTTDYFYEFAHFIRKYNINSKGSLIHYLEHFINWYFGAATNGDRNDIFYNAAWESTVTDEEFFAYLENNKIGDLKGKNAAECTERGALAQQILSLFGTETYYCVGYIDLGYKQEDHCFNIVKRKNDYALLDYSVTVPVFNPDGSLRIYYPFVGAITNEEFQDFMTSGKIKEFENYEYVNGNQKVPLNGKRMYAVGVLTSQKQSGGNPIKK